MAEDWDKALLISQTGLRNDKDILIALVEQEATKLLRVKPMITVLLAGYDFLIANLEVLRKHLEKP